jgi:hypothetical protein
MRHVYVIHDVVSSQAKHSQVVHILPLSPLRQYLTVTGNHLTPGDPSLSPAAISLPLYELFLFSICSSFNFSVKDIFFLNP